MHYGIWGNSIVALRCCDSIAFFYLPNENNQFLFQMQALKRTQAYCKTSISEIRCFVTKQMHWTTNKLFREKCHILLPWQPMLTKLDQIVNGMSK